MRELELFNQGRTDGLTALVPFIQQLTLDAYSFMLAILFYLWMLAYLFYLSKSRRRYEKTRSLNILLLSLITIAITIHEAVKGLTLQVPKILLLFFPSYAYAIGYACGLSYLFMAFLSLLFMFRATRICYEEFKDSLKPVSTS